MRAIKLEGDIKRRSYSYHLTKAMTAETKEEQQDQMNKAGALESICDRHQNVYNTLTLYESLMYKEEYDG